MTDHDPVCARWLAEYPSHFCTCTEIEEARVDERAAIMSRVKQDMTVEREQWTTLAQSVSAEQIRADERERIARAIEHEADDLDWDGAITAATGDLSDVRGYGKDLLHTAARIARGGQ